jgi:hypothetical protein
MLGNLKMKDQLEATEEKMSAISICEDGYLLGCSAV